jgi:hypothetical protein
MALGPTGKHNSIETFVTATPPQPQPVRLDPGYQKPVRALQFGPQGSTSAGTAHNWPDSYQRP